MDNCVIKFRNLLQTVVNTYFPDAEVEYCYKCDMRTFMITEVGFIVNGFVVYDPDGNLYVISKQSTTLHNNRDFKEQFFIKMLEVDVDFVAYLFMLNIEQSLASDYGGIIRSINILSNMLYDKKPYKYKLFRKTIIKLFEYGNNKFTTQALDYLFNSYKDNPDIISEILDIKNELQISNQVDDL